jgi:hypothetical protein
MPTTRNRARRDTEEVAFVSPDPVESEEALSTRPSSPQSAKTKSKSASNARPGPDSGPVAPRQPSAERAEAAAYTEVANRLLALEEKDQHWDQQVNDLTQRICVQDDAIESLKKRLAVLEEWGCADREVMVLRSSDTVRLFTTMMCISRRTAAIFCDEREERCVPFLLYHTIRKIGLTWLIETLLL